MCTRTYLKGLGIRDSVSLRYVDSRHMLLVDSVNLTAMKCFKLEIRCLLPQSKPKRYPVNPVNTLPEIVRPLAIAAQRHPDFT